MYGMKGMRQNCNRDRGFQSRIRDFEAEKWFDLIAFGECRALARRVLEEGRVDE